MKKLLIILLTLLMLVGCSSKITSIKDDVSKIDETDAEKLEATLTAYEGAFTADIPKGWETQICDYGYYVWIRIYDPNNPVLGINMLIKADELLKSEEAKLYYESLLYSTNDSYQYGEIAESLVVEHVEDFYNQMDDYDAFMKKYYKDDYGDFEAPSITNFKVIESADTNSEAYYNTPYEQKIMHATYTDAKTNKEGEGLFLGVLVDTLIQRKDSIDIGYRSMYNCVYISAPKGQLNEYFDLLIKIYKSIKFSDELNATIGTDLNITENKKGAVESILEDNDKVMSNFWKDRNRELCNAIVKEYLDSSNYELVVDSYNNLYKAYKGFIQNTTDTRFSLANENDYSNTIVGYIVKK